MRVDGARTDSYTADGSLGSPFKTIMGAVNQVVANGDNSATVLYDIHVNPAIYTETIDLSNAKLKCLFFFGYGAVVTGPQTILNIQNNDGMTDCMFYGFSFQSGATTAPFISVASTTNSTNMLNGTVFGFGLAFYDCCFIVAGGTSSGNANISQANFLFDRCAFPQTSPFFTFTNNSIGIMRETNVSQGSTASLVTNTGLPIPNGFAATQLQIMHCNTRLQISIDAGSNVILGNGTRLLTGITVNGLLRNIGACITTPITVNSGGTYREECGGFHNSTLTINAGGNYVQQGTLGIGDIFLASGVHISTGAASPNGAVVGNPGDLYLDTTRGTNSTLFVKESGVGTNTGWSAK